MQARAIFEAAADTGNVELEIMIPLVGFKAEFDMLKERIVAVAGAVEKGTGKTIPYLVGTMIELPRAALMAGEIAQSAQFSASAPTT